MISISEGVAVIGLSAATISGLWALIGAYHTSKRDLAHAKRNAEQAQNALATMVKPIDELEIDVSELRTIINMLLAERGQTNSGILGHKSQGRR